MQAKVHGHSNAMDHGVAAIAGRQFPLLGLSARQSEPRVSSFQAFVLSRFIADFPILRQRKVVLHGEMVSH
ncbi:MAG: hypothetical protein OXL36_06765 [Bryobacterales bacterium]|nr:hypothetical protein [Bryobacterales bacterium]MDE0296635.1 hypothetical protein [Bryobacterales bacterium]